MLIWPSTGSDLVNIVRESPCHFRQDSGLYYSVTKIGSQVCQHWRGRGSFSCQILTFKMESTGSKHVNEKKINKLMCQFSCWRAQCGWWYFCPDGQVCLSKPAELWKESCPQRGLASGGWESYFSISTQSLKCFLSQCSQFSPFQSGHR